MLRSCFFRVKKGLQRYAERSLSSSTTGLFFHSSPTVATTHVRQNVLGLTLGTTPSRRYYSSKGVETMQPPIGVSDFRKIIETRDSEGHPYLFVDKSLFIKDIIDDLAEVKLFTRPRRFGKTLNMSMLHHFFAREVDGKPTANLFRGLKIAQHEQYLTRHQGQHPVIFLTFQDIKTQSFDVAYDKLFELIRLVYLKHEKQILSPNSPLGSHHKRDFEMFLEGKVSDAFKQNSLKYLTFYLSQAYGAKPIVLIDEYDTPIQTAYVRKYYEEMLDFMRAFLGAGLKDNSYLEKAILTGILRVSRENLFSDLNNLKTYSLLNTRYSEHFGFTESEVVQLLESSGLEKNVTEVKNWYNGYQVGNSIIYNPWSIVNYIQEEGRLSSYWVNTSENALVKDLIEKSSTGFKAQFEQLLQDKPIETPINERVVFTNLETNESAIWTLLLMSGYLKANILKEEGVSTLCQLRIPNKEVKDLYQNFIAEWLSGVSNPIVFNQFLNNLLEGNIENFEDQLRTTMLQTFSVHDIKGRQPEKFFHGFMLGLIACVDPEQYTIDSNKEAGLGRYDIVIAPKNPSRLGIILEIKSIDDNKRQLKTAAEQALEQIASKQYEKTTLLKEVKSYLRIGVAFSGKELAVAHQKLLDVEKNNHLKPEK